MREENNFKKVSFAAIQKAGASLKANFGRVKTIKQKAKAQLVSNADLEAEQIIIQHIRKYFPSHSILSEETPHLNNSEYCWIIDPLDGTHNFIRKIPIFGISIALQYKDEVILGVLYFPLDKRLYWAEKQKGAYLNGKRIHVSKNSVLSQATCVYDSSIRYNPEIMGEVLKKVSRYVFNIRMLGSTAEHLALLAEGKIDLDIEFNDKVWDFAAGALLVKEAGGEFTDFEGKPWDTHIPNYVASNRIIHKEVLKIIKESFAR